MGIRSGKVLGNVQIILLIDKNKFIESKLVQWFLNKLNLQQMYLTSRNEMARSYCIKS